MLQPSHRYCKGSIWMLNSWDNCRELCTSCYRSRCLSSTRMGQHSSVACQPEALFEFLRFQRPPYSIYVAFPCPSQGLISFPQCGRAGRITGEPVCAEACDVQQKGQSSSSSLCWCSVGMPGILPAQNVVLGWEPTFLQAIVMVSKMKVSEVLCVVTWLSGTPPALCCQLELAQWVS